MRVLGKLRRTRSGNVIRHSMGPRGVVILTSNAVGIASFNVTHFSHDSRHAVASGTVNSIRCVDPRRTENRGASRGTSVCSMNMVLCRVLANGLPFRTRDTMSITVVRLRHSPRLPARVGTSVPGKLRRVAVRTVRGDRSGHCRSTSRVLYSLNGFEGSPSVAFSCDCFISSSPAHFINNIIARTPGPRTGRAATRGRGDKVVPVLANVTVTLILTVIILLVVFLPNVFNRANSAVAVPGFINVGCRSVGGGARCGRGFMFGRVGHDSGDRCPMSCICTRSVGRSRGIGGNARVALCMDLKPGAGAMGSIEGGVSSITMDRLGTGNFRIVVARVPDRSCRVGRIVHARPTRGMGIPRNAAVAIFISANGPARCIGIPDIVNGHIRSTRRVLASDGLLPCIRSISVA